MMSVSHVCRPRAQECVGVHDCVRSMSRHLCWEPRNKQVWVHGAPCARDPASEETSIGHRLVLGGQEPGKTGSQIGPKPPACHSGTGGGSGFGLSLPRRPGQPLPALPMWLPCSATAECAPPESDKNTLPKLCVQRDLKNVTRKKILQMCMGGGTVSPPFSSKSPRGIQLQLSESQLSGS